MRNFPEERGKMTTRRPSPRALPPLLAALVVVLGACSGRSESSRTARGPTSIRVVDAAGTVHVLPRPARRVVSLVPSATLTLADLGARSVLVGRTDYDTTAWERSLPSVGGGLDPSIEAIVALHPDLVVFFAGSEDPQTPARLAQLGIPHLAVRPDRISEIKRMIELLGRVTGHEARADSLVRAVDRGLDQVRREVAGLPRPRVAYVLGGTPPWVAGPRTYIDELITIAGGRNAFEDLDAPYAAVSPEELVARHIDLVLVSRSTAYDRSLTPRARVAVVGGALELPGPDVVAAASDLARLIHGDTLR